MASNKSNKKLTLPAGFDKDSILNRIPKNDLITRKGGNKKPIGFNKENLGLSAEETQKRFQALRAREESHKLEAKPVIKTPEPVKVNEATPLDSSTVAPSTSPIINKTEFNQTVQIKPKSADSKPKLSNISKKDNKKEQLKESSSPTFSFKQGDDIVSLDDISSESKPKKVDNRDKTLIDEMMKHYKYLEFDDDQEIAKLQKGIELRNSLEGKRRDLQAKMDDEDIVVNSSSNEADEGVMKIRREAYFSRHNRKSFKKKNTKTVFLQREVEIYDKNIVIDIARDIAVKVSEFIKKLRSYGLNVKENDVIDGDAAELAVEDMGHIAKRVKKITAEDKLKRMQSSNLESIPPVVTIMGHVDHGKTSLLDALRNCNVAEKEEGGITQHIGAYQVLLENGKKITFIDTPGHEAFTAIRSRGANLTHVIVIVIAADDGIMPQTIESIKHAKVAQVPIIVAINKIDRPNADVQKIKNELLAHEIISDDLGGDVMCIPISAKMGTNLDKLCESIVLQAEVYGAKAEINVLSSGVVLEGKLDAKKGVSSSLLVQNGTLKVGDLIVIGSSYSKIRLMLDDKGNSIKTATPSTPVEVYGLPDVPTPGEDFNVVKTEKLAREIAEHRKDKKAEQKQDLKATFSNFFGPKTEKKQFNIVIRADAQSTIEAIKYSIEKIKLPSEIELKIMQSSVGNITEADIKFANSYSATIFAFSVKVGARELELARKTNIEIKQHGIIYKIIDDLKELISEQLSPIIKDEIIGDVEVKEVFDIFKVGKIAGSVVKKGVVRRNSIVKIFRGKEEIGEGKLKTLKHFKENVKELAQGNECGVQVEGFEGFKPRDLLQIINRTEEKRTL